MNRYKSSWGRLCQRELQTRIFLINLLGAPSVRFCYMMERGREAEEKVGGEGGGWKGLCDGKEGEGGYVWAQGICYLFGYLEIGLVPSAVP